MPLDAGILHAGVYGGAGDAVRVEDGILGPDTNSSTLAIGGGAMIQLDLNTRIALTARFGVDNAHGETAQRRAVRPQRLLIHPARYFWYCCFHCSYGMP